MCKIEDIEIVKNIKSLIGNLEQIDSNCYVIINIALIMRV